MTRLRRLFFKTVKSSNGINSVFLPEVGETEKKEKKKDYDEFDQEFKSRRKYLIIN